MSGSTTIAFGTKAETLARLRPLLRRSVVESLLCFSVVDWRERRAAQVEQVERHFGWEDPLVVRSSAQGEDSAATSRAGAYVSVLGVRGPAALIDAVDRVVASYGRFDARDQVLIQTETRGVRLSGVLMSRDLDTLAPYYVLNYDDATGSTDSVTSGRAVDLKTYVRFRDAEQSYPSDDLRSVFAAARELEALLGDRFEMEFAVCADGSVRLFQARPLTVSPPHPPPDSPTVRDWLTKIAKKVEKLALPHPHLHGTRTVFGVMPDWNPAEIIGLRPRALALTLYKEVITDAVWAYMRHNYGYRDLRSFPLMVSFLGVPYVDVRVSFNSFIPKGLREPLSAKLADYYVDRLIAAPQSHDKVEFEIVFSCYYPGIRRDVARLEAHGFSGTEIGELLAALRDLTNRIIHPSRGFWRDDLAKIEELRSRHRQVRESSMSSVSKFYWLIEDCKRYGTLPFSGLARAGFIAVQFLQGLVRIGVLSPQEMQAFLASLDTVTRQMNRDVARLAHGELDRTRFLETWGHLRPGTYDLLSPRYDENFERYFGDLTGLALDGEASPAEPFRLREPQRREIAAELQAHGIDVSIDDLLAFLRAGIEGREYAKLVFTRSISDGLVQLEKLGRQCRLTREDLSHLNVRKVLELYSTLDALDLRDVLLRDIEANRQAYDLTRVVRMPELILSPADVFHFHIRPTHPNFVTLKRVSAPVIEEGQFDVQPIRGKAVCIRSADPGYDWIFSKGIAALVTQFGGANSHMAIRAAEQGVPAVIGCGESNFSQWSQAGWLEIDCANRRVVVVR